MYKALTMLLVLGAVTANFPTIKVRDPACPGEDEYVVVGAYLKSGGMSFGRKSRTALSEAAGALAIPRWIVEDERYNLEAECKLAQSDWGMMYRKSFQDDGRNNVVEKIPNEGWYTSSYSAHGYPQRPQLRY